MVTSAIILWNNTFGTRFDLEYPPELAQALARLRPVADLKLPNFPAAFDVEDAPSGPQFVDSDGDSEPRSYRRSSAVASRGGTPYLDSSPLPSRLKSKSPHPTIELSKSASKKRASDEARATKLRPKPKRDTTPRLRHDDSQIQFAAISSSPPASTAPDSQLLTDRQREVKERQQQEAATMFPDLRSSPRPKARKGKASSTLALTSDLPLSMAEAGPGTPAIGRMGAFDDFITSSPTPRREAGEGVGQFGADAEVSDREAGDVPSSPPKGQSREASPVEGAARVQEETGPSASDDFWNVTSFGSMTSLLLDQRHGGAVLGLPQGASEKVGDEDEEEEEDDDAEFLQQLPTPAQLGNRQADQTHADVASADALSSPNAGRERDDATTDEVFVDARSSPQIEVQNADASSAQGSARRRRRRRNRKEASVEAETAQVAEAPRRHGEGVSSTSGMDWDSMRPLPSSHDAPANTDRDPERHAEEADVASNASTRRSLSLGVGENFDRSAYTHVASSPELETRKTRKRRRGVAAPVEEQEQNAPVEAARPKRAMRSADKRNSSIGAVSEEPPAAVVAMDSIPARTRSRAKRGSLASTIPETPTVRTAAPDTRRRKSPQTDEGEEPQPETTQPVKRRRVSGSTSRGVVVEDSQVVDPEPEVVVGEAIVVTPHGRRSKRERIAMEKVEEGEGGVRKRGRGRPRRSEVREVEEGEWARSERVSVDLDEGPTGEVVVEDSFMGVKGEGEDSGLDGAGEGGGENEGALGDGAATDADAEAEAQIMEGMNEARSSRRVSLSRQQSRGGDRSSRSSVSVGPVVVAEATVAAAAGADADVGAFTGASAVERLKELVEGLKEARVSRAEAMRMEEMVWDFKAELYAAERRGREG